MNFTCDSNGSSDTNFQCIVPLIRHINALSGVGHTSRADSTPVVFIKHTAARELLEQGMTPYPSHLALPFSCQYPFLPALYLSCMKTTGDESASRESLYFATPSNMELSVKDHDLRAVSFIKKSKFLSKLMAR